MAVHGVVVHFDPEKGFGFLRRPGIDEDVFVHIRQIQGRVPLTPGQSVRFEVVQEERGPAAREVVPGPRATTPVARYLALALLCMVVLSALTLALGLPPIPTYLAGINLLALGFYGLDKRLAGREEGPTPRIPEFVLLILLALGGFVGSLAGQQLFRHKTQKTRFRLQFWAIVVLQVAVVWFLHFR